VYCGVEVSRYRRLGVMVGEGVINMDFPICSHRECLRLTEMLLRLDCAWAANASPRGRGQPSGASNARSTLGASAIHWATS
jgi:hypothetical protein